MIAPQGHFRRAGRHYLVGFQPVRPLTFAMLFGELDGGLRHPPRFWHWRGVCPMYRSVDFRGETSGDGPLSWSTGCLKKRKDNQFWSKIRKTCYVDFLFWAPKTQLSKGFRPKKFPKWSRRQAPRENVRSIFRIPTAPRGVVRYFWRSGHLSLKILKSGIFWFRA